MLPSWLTFTALLAASTTTAVAGLTVKPTGRVRGQPEEELTLHCGDGQRSAGPVLFWHSPFGYHHPWDPLSSLDPVSMGRDGSLVISNTSGLHSGLYYCLRWRPEGTTLWQYQLHVTAFRVRREGGPEDGTWDWTEVRSEVVPKDESEFRPSQDKPDDRPEVQSEDGGTAGVSHGQFAAAVVASVLLTFVVGFSAGALARPHVLRCFAAVSKQLRSPRQQARQPDLTDYGSDVTTIIMSPAYENQAFQMGPVGPDDSLASTPPPPKPQRSFRYRRDEEGETAAYLEGCDHVRTAGGESEEGRNEEGRKEEREKGRTEEGEEESEVSSFSLLGDDGGSQSETEEHREEEDGGSREEEEEDGGSREEEEEDGGSREEEKEDGGSREEEEEDGGSREEEEEDGGSREEEDGGSREEEDGGSREEEDGGSREEEDGGSREEEDGESSEEDDESSEEKDGDEAQTSRQDEDKEREETSEDEDGGEDGADSSRESDRSSEGDGDVSPSASRPARRSRVIRLYQYDQDGQRYGHLPDPPPEAPGPAPKLKQRSLSLTRLNAIMAAAAASPLDARDDGEEKPQFYMDI